VVCCACVRWNLAPFDHRLETIDACERIFRDTHTRCSIDNIGLARHREGLELIRIGPAAELRLLRRQWLAAEEVAAIADRLALERR